MCLKSSRPNRHAVTVDPICSASVRSSEVRSLESMRRCAGTCAGVITLLDDENAASAVRPDAINAASTSIPSRSTTLTGTPSSLADPSTPTPPPLTPSTTAPATAPHTSDTTAITTATTMFLTSFINVSVSTPQK